MAQRINYHSSITIKRECLDNGQLKVKTGETITGDDILFEGEKSKGYRTINLSKETRLSPGAIAKLFTKKEGDRIYRRDILLKRNGFLGLGKITYLSPVTGRIISIDRKSTILTIQYPEQKIKIPSGVWGKIVKIERDIIDIETRAITIKGVVGLGSKKEGFIKILTSRNEFMLPQSLDRELDGSILIGGIISGSDFFVKMNALKITGVIAGSSNARECEILQKNNQIGCILTEGFGNIPLGEDIWEILNKYDNRYVLLNSDTAELIIPLRPEEEIPTNERAALVRVIHSVHFGKIGKITKKSDTLHRLNSGLSAIMVDIKTLEGEDVKVPINNIEEIYTRLTRPPNRRTR